MPYLVIGIVLVLVAVVFLLTTFPPEKKEENKTNTAGEKLNLFQHKQLLLGVIATVFLCRRAGVCVEFLYTVLRICCRYAGTRGR
jgi:fucose permease